MNAACPPDAGAGPRPAGTGGPAARGRGAGGPCPARPCAAPAAARPAGRDRRRDRPQRPAPHRPRDRRGAAQDLKARAAGRFPTLLFLGRAQYRRRPSGEARLAPVASNRRRQFDRARTGSLPGRKGRVHVADAHDAVDGALAQFAYQREDLCGHGPAIAGSVSSSGPARALDRLTSFRFAPGGCAARRCSAGQRRLGWRRSDRHSRHLLCSGPQGGKPSSNTEGRQCTRPDCHAPGPLTSRASGSAVGHSFS